VPPEEFYSEFIYKEEKPPEVKGSHVSKALSRKVTSLSVRMSTTGS
jgi:pentatricopeptide repeat protein